MMEVIKNSGHSGRPAKLNRKVICLETGEAFDNYRDAAARLGVDRSNIYNCLKGFRGSAGGYHFEYSDNDYCFMDEVDREIEEMEAEIEGIKKVIG